MAIGVRIQEVNHLRRIRAWRPTILASIGIVGMALFFAVFADYVMPYDPSRPVLTDRLLPPFRQDSVGLTHQFGTDALGRDILSRIILGARVSVIVAVSAILVGGGVGTALGLMAGYYGKRLDSAIMRVADGMLAFPTIFLALFLAVVLGPGFGNLLLVISAVLWARFARVVRGEVLSLKTREFVALAKVAGASSFRIILRHILPNVLNTVIVMATLQVGYVIILEASLSFLGVGVPPPTPSWGSMVAAGRGYVATAWWVATFPGLFIFLTVAALNLFGDWLRDSLDPKLRYV